MNKTLSVVIPVYNEEERLQACFGELRRGLPRCGLKLTQIVFVNDGSTDKTLKILKTAKSDLEKKTKAEVKIVSYRKNCGKGYAVKRGMLASNTDYSLLIDADMSTSLLELKKFAPLIRKNADVVVGTRKNGESTVTVPQPLYRQYMGKVFTLLSQIILNTWVTDFTCGFKLFSRDARLAVFPEAKIRGWGYDAEILYLARKMGYEINEKSVLWANDKRSKVSIVKAAINSFVELLRIRFLHFGLFHRIKNLKLSFN